MPSNHPPAAPPDRPAPRSGGVPDSLLLGGLALLLSLTVLTWTAAGIAGLLAHGSWPSGLGFTHTPLALRALVTDPGDLAAAWPAADAATLPRPGLFWGVLVSQFLVLGTLTLTTAISLSRRRALRRAARDHLHKATAAQPQHEIPLTPASPHPAPPAHPTPPAQQSATHPPAAQQPPTEQPAAQEPASDHHPTATLLTGAHPPALIPSPGLTPPQAAGNGHPGAGLRLRHTADPADALRTAEGPALVVTADTALWRDTVGARSKLGPTHLYDPDHVTEAPTRLRWAPESGCADMAVARSRAAALLSPVRSPAKADETAHAAAETVLRCCLHAAAVSGQPFRQVHRWTTGTSVGEAVRVLRKDRQAAAGAAGELEAMLITRPDRHDPAWELIRRALSSLSRLHVRNACTASRNDTLAQESFLREMGTLYLTGESLEDPRREPGAMPLLTALAVNVVEHGRRMAERSSSGRLDPPLTLILDSPATVAPLAGLPALLARGEEYGVRTFAYLRSMDQARAWWPELDDAHNGRSSSIR
ncbi:type VI secretion protein [Streptomyces sp. 549]|uniref:type VI secretion protein n=1 Tax=Streptomyces sp. 549 TaxID=3049076 RepID=UPI0024C229A9|nr:type VI secretion protein [Streptomyces sp. 549]MDK1476241.1 type VI secretion protein [Streptomyces sp. 549]